MWKNLLGLAKPIRLTSFLGAKCTISPLLRDVSALNVNQQSRTTFILRRKTTPSLHKKGKPQKKLKARHFIYELVEDTNTRKHKKMEIILTDYVSGLGAYGDKISVKPNFAYNNLLLPGLAVYSTPENSEKYCTPQEESIKPKFSSPYASRTVGFLSKMTVAIVMNKEVPWKLEPWHIRMSFRKAGVDVAEHAIELPEKPITGPNLDLECKIFFVTITVNGTEKVSVKCQIHHWSTKISDRLPWVEEFWNLDKEYVFSEETKTLEHINDSAGSSPP